MFFEMACSCTAALQFELPDAQNDVGWLLALRFANSHVDCGYMTPIVKDEQEITKRYEITAREEDI